VPTTITKAVIDELDAGDKVAKLNLDVDTANSPIV
jgi:hypothetical protein